MEHDVVDLIMQDHREVERLFGELMNHPEKRPLLTPVLCGLLIAHSRAEEAEVYPVARNEVGAIEEVEHGQEEHAQAERLLGRLAECDPDSARYEEVLDKVVEAVTHHVKEEESIVLPGMRSGLDTARRNELGRAFASMRARHLGDMPGQASREELVLQAQNAGVSGASGMNKAQLEKELQKLG